MSAPPRQRRPYAARVPMDVRREQLMDAALAVIVRDGYGGVSVDAVAKEAGVTRPVVYGAFEGLGDLLTALLDRQQVRAFGRLLAALPDDPDPKDPAALVEVAIERLVTMVREDPDTWRPILQPPDGLPDAVLQRIEADREQVRGIFAGLIAGVSEQQDGVPFDADLYAHAMLAVVEHFGRLLIDDPDRFDTQRMVDGATRLLRLLWR
ncbi:TetR/AcrR family transcriptional regulator [Nocardioides humilatus]|uniref:TetR/AcrR family transcriptional regulator n=1 Tax=Nocardioides humilatus TaxID=2607660 RepID=A0A5B1LGP4_9ACTN|nr:TetR/AcrR family transcriptional regulator [Nocardioides humilatus]KAA1419504.1 TetR/AcrR family transcriptional regulator [Nocardioides humilatus]